MNTYEVWIEGFAATGQHGQARLAAVVEGVTFKVAVTSYMEGIRFKFFDAKNMTYWGCHICDNEVDARRSFG